MTAADEPSPPRTGSGADLSRRMDRMEQNHEALVRDVASLSGIVARVEQNQQHMEEMNALRFKSLDTAVGQVGTDLKTFMTRIESIIDGTVQTAETRRGAELVADFTAWRKETDKRITGVEDIPSLETRVSLLEGSAQRQQGSIAAIGVGKAAVLMFAAVAAPVVSLLVAVIFYHR